MPKEDTVKRTIRRKKETTLREAVVARVEQFFELHGLEAALRRFDDMKVDFSGIRDWPDIEKEVMDFFMEKRKLALQADGERKQQMDQAWIQGLARGVNGGQVVLQTGSNSQAPYYSTTSTIGGHK